MTHNESQSNYIPLFNDSLPKLAHGSFTRHGGISTAPFTSNNISFDVGDDPKRVKQNRERMAELLGLKCLMSAHQVHGESVYHVTPSGEENTEVNGYDALITDRPGTGLLIQHADCQAVMVYDAINQIVAAIHNGWRGSIVNIVAKTIAEMKLTYNSKPEDLVAAVGPSLGPCCSEFIHYRDELPQSFLPFQVRENYFDFWQITRCQLIQCGVNKESITIAGICTSCSPDHFSYRRACRNGNGATGRNGTLIALVSRQR